MNKRKLNQAIKKFGSQAALARELGISRQYICNIKRGVPAPKWIVDRIEELLSYYWTSSNDK